MQTASVLLLSNASVTGAAFQWPGGRGFFAAGGTFGGGNVALQFLAPDGTWAGVPNLQGTAVSLTAAGGQAFDLPPCLIRAAVTTATAVTARADRVPG